MYQLYHKVQRWIHQGDRRGKLLIGIRCKHGKHRSMAVMLLFAACARRYNHTVFCYAPEAAICGCPERSCRYLQGLDHEAMRYARWNRQAEDAKAKAELMWDKFTSAASA